MIHRLLLLGIFFLCAAALLHANTDLRNWTMAGGEMIKGELVDYDPESGEVILKLNFKEDKTYSFDDFSAVDQAWLVEWVEFVDRLGAQVAELKGTFEHVTTVGDYPTDLFIYYPSAMKNSSEPLPAMILFHPGGKAPRYLLRHMEAGEKASLVLIACGQFRNTHKQPEEDKLALRWKEVFPQILEKVKLDPKRLFLGGASGGASRAFDFSVTTDHPWAGIYSSGGWLGGTENYDRDYPDHMRVAMVNGNNDKAANHWVDKDTEVLEKHDCKVALISFEGGHQVPPAPIQLKAFNWLLDQEAFIEE
jgi:hypothetical protein